MKLLIPVGWPVGWIVGIQTIVEAPFVPVNIEYNKLMIHTVYTIDYYIDYTNTNAYTQLYAWFNMTIASFSIPIPVPESIIEPYI